VQDVQDTSIVDNEEHLDLAHLPTPPSTLSPEGQEMAVDSARPGNVDLSRVFYFQFKLKF
jgi:hypothetical protein